MISLESQVLERHLSFFDGKSVLFAGGISDNFPQTLASKMPNQSKFGVAILTMQEHKVRSIFPLNFKIKLI